MDKVCHKELKTDEILIQEIWESISQGDNNPRKAAVRDLKLVLLTLEGVS